MAVAFPSTIFSPGEISDCCSSKIRIVVRAIDVASDQPSHGAPDQSIRRRMIFAQHNGRTHGRRQSVR